MCFLIENCFLSILLVYITGLLWNKKKIYRSKLSRWSSSLGFTTSVWNWFELVAGIKFEIYS